MLYATNNPNMLRALIGEELTIEFAEHCKSFEMVEEPKEIENEQNSHTHEEMHSTSQNGIQGFMVIDSLYNNFLKQKIEKVK